jgi:polyferredoxin
VAYYEQQRPDDREQPPGCLDVIVITRAVFGVLMWPLVIMFVAILDLGVTFYLYATRPLLALIPVAVTAAAIGGFTIWERHRYRLKDE